MIYLVEVMNPGSVLEYKLCCSCYLAWRYVVGAEHYIVEFAVTVVSTKFVIACCDVAGWGALHPAISQTHHSGNNQLHTANK
jgi:hypothetical protein